MQQCRAKAQVMYQKKEKNRWIPACTRQCTFGCLLRDRHLTMTLCLASTLESSEGPCEIPGDSEVSPPLASKVMD